MQAKLDEVLKKNQQLGLASDMLQTAPKQKVNNAKRKDKQLMKEYVDAGERIQKVVR